MSRYNAHTYIALTALLIVVVIVVNDMFWHVDPQSPQVACRRHMQTLSQALLLYADDYGEFPPQRGWNVSLKDYARKKGLHWLKDHTFTCPADASGVLSYELDPQVAGVRLDSIPEHQRAHTVMLKERNFPGSHRQKSYADGHAVLKLSE